MLKPAKRFAIERKLFMNQPRIAIIGLLASLVLATAFSGTAQAQAAAPAGPTHIAVIDFRKAYFTMKETKDSNDEIKGMQDSLELKGKADKRALQDLQDQMTQAVKADSAKHQQLMEEFDQKS